VCYRAKRERAAAQQSPGSRNEPHLLHDSLDMHYAEKRKPHTDIPILKHGFGT
jgi:hypothetical protein